MKEITVNYWIVMIIIMGVAGRQEDEQHQLKSKNEGKPRVMFESVNKVFKASNTMSYEIMKRFKRDMLFFVEGLSFIGKSTLLESSGMQNQSEAHYINLEDMSISNSFTFDESIFGEGSQMIRDPVTGEMVVFVMTYKNGIVYKLDEKLTRVIHQYKLPHQMREGWGMAKLDDNTILATDGTNTIFHISPSDFTIQKEVKVFEKNGAPLMNLNEIEMIDGLAYMNIFLKNIIVVVDPNTGDIKDTLNFNGIVQFLESDKQYQGYTKGNNLDNCLNGIAFNQETNQLLITGKNWPYIYEVRLYNTI